MSSVTKLQLYVEKLQILAPPTYSTHNDCMAVENSDFCSQYDRYSFGTFRDKANIIAYRCVGFSRRSIHLL